MADVRALLKAKRQEVRISHPYATYNAAGQLRCIICGTAVKHASAWEGHLGSKGHRVAVSRAREEERRKDEEDARRRAEEDEEKVRGKRKARDEDEDDEDEDADDAMSAKRQRTEEVEPAGGFPADFFSDPSRAPPPRDADADDEDVVMGDDAGGGPSSGPAPALSELDREWESFEKAVLQAPPPPDRDPQETFARATVFAEPELAPIVPDGFPPREGDALEAADAMRDDRLSEEEERRKKQLEERELIMDRLLEEERAQEEADSRVSVLKGRLDLLKKKREQARKAQKPATRT
ncbi:hypothetical protein BV25DRAFT_1146386 [Artomyces pyxidatus]|uniref:Uncharacterized protein n=1 Tax=Artomyces pyxidatus TaxID=48021 RepID=A0ACB8SSK8_9AGAM|nr:hypothetical protein BV25DRAFT_1146386 [Artomyces pyxidatus]